MVLQNTIYRYTRENFKDIRVLKIDPSINVAYYVEIEKDQNMPKRYMLSALIGQLERGELEAVPDYYALPIDFDRFSKEEKCELEKIYSQYKDLWTEHMIEILEPSEQKKFLKDLSTKENIEVYKIKRQLSKFLQYGFSRKAFIKDYSKCGKSKRNIKSEVKLGAPKAPDKNGNPRLGKNVMKEDNAWIEDYMSRYYYRENGLTKKQVYDKLIAEKYSFQMKNKPNIVNNVDAIISYEQFLYHANQMETNEKILKTISQIQYNLNNRMLYSNATLETDGAGKRFLIDSTVGDIWLVDKDDRNRIIGRPVFYEVIDEFSRLIVGIYVGLEGPSWNGACMALLNMIEDKVAFVKRVCDRDITEDEWPSHHIPEIILADRGEFEGTCPEKLVSLLNIDLETTPPYRGDLKGIVERRFRTINEHIRYTAPGAIQKEYNARVDQDPRYKAELDIDEIRRWIVHQVIKYNNITVKKYPASKDQILHDIPSIPSVLWKWSIENLRGAARTVDIDKFKMALLRDTRGTLSREGIQFMGAYYWNDNMHISEWIPAKNKKNTIMKNKYVLLYDSRNYNTVYMPHKDWDGYDVLFLMDKSEMYRDMCEGEVIFFNKLATQTEREQEQRQKQNDIDADYYEKEILREAKKKNKAVTEEKPKTKKEQIANVEEYRANAKRKEEQENAIRLGNNESLQGNDDKQVDEKYVGNSRFDKYL